MFTGIVEEIGTIKSIRRGIKSISLEIGASTILEGTKVGDSICTNGVCLTVTKVPSLQERRGGESSFFADVMPQTMRMTALGGLKPGDKVNLERALMLQSRLGGHIVSGHIDGVGKIVRREQDDTALWLWIEAPASIMRYIIDKGSITIQGVSLTVAKVPSQQERVGGESCFAVSLIPHTQNATTLHSAKVGDTVNLENDVIAKYVENFVRYGASGSYDTEPLAPTKRPSGYDNLDLYRDFMLKA